MKPYLKWPLIGMGVAVLLILGFYLIENHRGAKVWSDTENFLESEGETLNFADLIQPLPPGEENFCAIPLMASMTDFEVSEDKEIIYRNAKEHDRITAMKLPYSRNAEKKLEEFGFQTGQPPDFEAWSVLFTESPDFETGDPSLPAAERVLKALSRYESEYREIADGTLRESAVWQFEWNREVMKRLNSPLPHIGEARNVAKVFGLRAVASIETGDTAAARESIVIMLKLAKAAESQGLFIPHLVGTGIKSLVLDVVWFGHLTEKWNEDDLSWLAGNLEGIVLVEPGLFALRTEMANSQVAAMDFLKNTDARTLAKLNTIDPSSGGGILQGVLMLACPDGYWDCNKSDGCRIFYEDGIRPLKTRDFSSLGPNLFQYEAKRPFSELVALAMPVYRKMLERLVQMTFYRDAARVSVALERHRGAHGVYPDELKDLVPDFLDPVPVDPMDGNPLRYVREKDGRYRIYSIGLDRFDDGGEVIFATGGGRRLQSQGDWVWAYTYPEREADR